MQAALGFLGRVADAAAGRTLSAQTVLAELARASRIAQGLGAEVLVGVATATLEVDEAVAKMREAEAEAMARLAQREADEEVHSSDDGGHGEARGGSGATAGGGEEGGSSPTLGGVDGAVAFDDEQQLAVVAGVGGASGVLLLGAVLGASSVHRYARRRRAAERWPERWQFVAAGQARNVGVDDIRAADRDAIGTDGGTHQRGGYWMRALAGRRIYPL
mmetsp:Transcript_5764/g.14765  ORF Transcript_5764/g.14765 Transcript_5764/m.14765 type:complete len:218 (+) Transcript_5764:184-837(+)